MAHTLHGPSLAALNPATDRILVVEDDERIVATVAAFLQVHVEGAWIAPEARGRVSVGRHLLRGLRELVGDRDVAMMATNSESERLIEGLRDVTKLEAEHYVARI